MHLPEELHIVSSSSKAGGDQDQPTPPNHFAASPVVPQPPFGYDGTIPPGSDESSRSDYAAITTARLSLLTSLKPPPQTASSSNELGSPLDIRSPTSQASYTSTTDDDDVLTFDRPANSFPAQSGTSLQKPLSSAATSYFLSASSASSLPRHSTSSSTKPKSSISKHARSPLSHTLSTTTSVYPLDAPEPHDYTETEYWGWVILFVTWLTFTVGMGSCLDIWSWAWDVGETPYAPPELEDDPTLPIVGYYPALIVLTGVVAWAWITVAWVGMKYFRHAKIEV